MKPLCCFFLLFILGCSRSDTSPPSEAEIRAAIEDHVRQLVGNTFQQLTIMDLKRQEPKEQYVPELKSKVMTYPVSFALRVDTTHGRIEDPVNTTTFYRDHGKLVPLPGTPKP